MATKDFNTATLKAKLTFLETTATTDTTLYTVPSSACFKAQTLSMSNRHTAAVTIDVYVTPSGVTLAAKHKVLVSYSLGIGDTMSLEAIFEGMMLGEGDFITVKTSVANVVSFFLTGVEGT